MKLLAVRDKAIEAFGVPFTVVHIGQGNRSFVDEINNPESQMGRHPEHYDLYHIADYDEQTGEIILVEIKLIARGTDVKNTA